MTKLVLDHLTRRFNQAAAVDNVCVSIADGEFVSLLGPSGCGKSTTLRLIAGFDAADGGRILFDDEDVSALPPERRDIGMVFQSYALFPHMSVSGNLAFGLEMRRVAKSEIRVRVARALDLVRLTGKEGRYPRELSGGQQQRVALARALVIEPRILLLDEPLANLDANLRDEMRVFIRELQRRVGITTIYVTHDQAEAMSMSDRVVVMFNGKIAQCAPPRTIYERPETYAVARFIGEANFLRARISSDAGQPVAETALGVRPLAAEATAAPGDSVHVLIRPEAVALLPDAGPDATGIGTGIVESAQYGGSVTAYRLRLGDGEQIQVQAVGPARFAAGDRAMITLAPDALWPILDVRS